MSNNLAHQNVVRLIPWDEASGRPKSIVEDHQNTVLDFGKFRVLLNPTEATSIKDQLNEDLIGQWISILKTDIPDRPLLLRTLSSDTTIAASSSQEEFL